MENLELKSKIQSLETLPFDFKEIPISIDRVKATNFLRKAQVYNSQIDKEHEKELKVLLDNIVVNRFRSLAPQFSEELLNKMLCFMYRGLIKTPIDILVIDKAVFVKEAEYSDWGELFDYEIIMFQNDDYFLTIDSIDFNMPHDYMNEPRSFSVETTKKSFDFICEAINKALYEKYKCDVVMPLYKLNDERTFYGYDGMTCGMNLFRDVEVYLNKQSFEIIDNILECKSIDIKMVVQDGEDISLYIIHQSFDFENDEPVWNIEKSDEKVWILSDAASNVVNRD